MSVYVLISQVGANREVVAELGAEQQGQAEEGFQDEDDQEAEAGSDGEQHAARIRPQGGQQADLQKLQGPGLPHEAKADDADDFLVIKRRNVFEDGDVPEGVNVPESEEVKKKKKKLKIKVCLHNAHNLIT